MSVRKGHFGLHPDRSPGGGRGVVSWHLLYGNVCLVNQSHLMDFVPANLLVPGIEKWIWTNLLM